MVRPDTDRKPTPLPAAVSSARIAIASSGLGHIRRGIETWADDLAQELARSSVNVTLFQGKETSSAAESPASLKRVAFNSLSRFDKNVERQVKAFLKLGGWKYGFGSVYQIEQTYFTLKLWQSVRKDYDIVHVQDPWVALLMTQLHQRGLSRPYAILGHGTEEDDSFLKKLEYLQHLSPCYLETWIDIQPALQMAFAIPNFVDTSTFLPGDKQAARHQWNLPEDATVMLCVAAIKSTHKRVDALVQEFKTFLDTAPSNALLVVAGAREKESDAIIEQGKAILGDRVRFLESVNRSEIPSLYQAADMFVIASLHEMMPIAMLEALASGLPIVCNNTPTMSWMAGPAGRLTDISMPGNLSKQLQSMMDTDLRRQCSIEARKRALNVFSKEVVVQEYIAMYDTILLKSKK
ncbi:MAG: glycosyltransferase family 4 protein [Armatimonas sp.]